MVGRMVVAVIATGIVMLCCGPVAGADEESGVSIGVDRVDDAIGPGNRVRVFGTCDDPGFTTAPVVSPVLDPVELHGRGGHDPTLVSDARVKLSAAPGLWPVSFRCGQVTVTGYLRVDTDSKMVIPVRLHGSEIVALLAGCVAGMVFMAGLGGLIYRGGRPQKT
jgi:hypothetical protein